AIDPWEVWSSICQGVGGGAGGGEGAGAGAAVIGVFCVAADLLDKAITPPPTELLALHAAVVSLDLELNNLEAQVANIVYEERREEVLTLARAIDQERAAV